MPLQGPAHRNAFGLVRGLVSPARARAPSFLGRFADAGRTADDRRAAASCTVGGRGELPARSAQATTLGPVQQDPPFDARRLPFEVARARRRALRDQSDHGPGGCPTSAQTRSNRLSKIRCNCSPTSKSASIYPASEVEVPAAEMRAFLRVIPLTQPEKSFRGCGGSPKDLSSSSMTRASATLEVSSHRTNG